MHPSQVIALAPASWWGGPPGPRRTPSSASRQAGQGAVRGRGRPPGPAGAPLARPRAGGPGGCPGARAPALLPLALLLALGIPAANAQNPPLLDCNQPVDVSVPQGSLQANVRFQGSAGETIFIRLLANTADPGFGLASPVVVDPFGNPY